MFFTFKICTVVDEFFKRLLVTDDVFALYWPIPRVRHNEYVIKINC